MNITITGQSSDALQQVIHKRLGAALGQHESWITRVGVRLSDENGPRGGVDKLCRFEIGLRCAGRVQIEQRGSDYYEIVTAAAERAKQAVGRKVARLRQKAA